MTGQVNAILDLYSGFRAYGYVLFAEPVDGEETLFISTYRNALDALSCTIKGINKHYHTRGKSKAALSILHSIHPEPVWGVEVAA